MKCLLVYESKEITGTKATDDISVYSIDLDSLPKRGDIICPTKRSAFSGEDSNLYKVHRVECDEEKVFGHDAIVYAQHSGHKLF